MIRFNIFVDGSNLIGSMKSLGLRIEDYEEFYTYILRQAVSLWGSSVIGNSPQVRLNRVLWYAVGSIDQWDLDNEKVKAQLLQWFNSNKQLKNEFSRMADGKQEPATLFLKEIKEWYIPKQDYVKRLYDFHFAINSKNNFINIIPCGRLKVNIIDRSITEKGIDTSLAVDMVALSDTYDVALVISGDADSIPSIEYVKRHGKHVAVIEFIKGYPPENRGRQSSSKLKAVADFVVPIYEEDLLRQKIGIKDQKASF